MRITRSTVITGLAVVVLLAASTLLPAAAPPQDRQKTKGWPVSFQKPRDEELRKAAYRASRRGRRYEKKRAEARS